MLNGNDYDKLTQYIVMPNDSLYKIAKKYNTNIEDIKRINNLIGNTIYPNQILYIPTNKANSNNTYLTCDGDTIKDICNKFKITLEDLNNYNDIDKLILSKNQLLLIERKNNNDKKYIIIGNEKIEDILSKYNLSPLQFLKLNEKLIISKDNEIIISE